MKILVVDDEALLVKGIRFNLQNEGYEVITGSDGLEAVRAVQEKSPDLVVLDVMMPNMDGLTACAKIREFSDVPIIMLTAKTDDMDKLIGFDMGVEGTVIDNFKRAGWRVIAFPFFIMAGTLVASAICAIFLPITLREGLAIGAGFGWYSFAPAAIMERGHITAGAISFMHNIIREYISVLTIPIVAKRIGYLEGMSVCGCSAMDVCLPVIERSTRSDIAVYAFISGAVQPMAVPILVPLLLG